jgi:aryl-alcohol dehydrogenase-like predicted oxidoreductase
MSNTEPELSPISRREFLRYTSLGAVGVSLAGAGVLAAERNVAQTVSLPSETEPWQMRYRPLGQTGLNLSEVSLGGHYDGPGCEAKGAKSQEMRHAVVQRALDLGINFFDTNYDEERQTLGVALKGKRDRVFVASDVNNESNLDGKQTRDNILRQIEAHLALLQTDHIDIFRLMAGILHPTEEQMEGTLEAFETLRAQGQARFFALSIHDPAVLAGWLAKGRPIDAVYVPFSFLIPKAAEALFPTVTERQVGVIVIKPFAKGSLFRLARDDQRLHDLPRSPEESLAVANLKWILSHPAVTTVIPGMETPAEVEQNVRASGSGPLRAEEKAALERAASSALAALPEGYGWLRDWARA